MASAYSPEQIDRYLEYIDIPSRYRRAANPSLGLEFLSTLHKYHICHCPYENLSLHYSPSHAISLDPQQLYEKIVGNARGRGGYCMENSIFFNHVLRGLGFRVYTAGAKIRHRVNGSPQGDYIGWVHVVNIVIFDVQTPDGTVREKQKYAVDVSFGGDGPRSPLPMIHGHVVQNIGTQQIRLVHDFIPSQVHRSEEDGAQRMWIYQYRNQSDSPWNSFYAFPEFEFTQQDFEIMNFYTSQSAESFQTFAVLVVKFLKKPLEGDQEGKEEVYGKVMLVNGDVKINRGGRTELIKTCRTEAGRVAALEEFFGITLTPEEIESIKGRVSDLGKTELSA